MSSASSPASATGPEGVDRSEQKAPRLGARNTKQRDAVYQVLTQEERFLSAKEVHNKLLSQGTKVGLATVYRTLQAMADLELVDVLFNQQGEAKYRFCESNEHHHHLVCTECSASVEIDGGPVEAWAEQLAEQNGYTKTGHVAEVFGVCAECSEDEKK
ncbi:Fur family transcriptional regulator [Corynebacterium ulceribovis]|uniref:Fur family transcriptional regulator n=1 Tax=Corynebacterium ulceribovis TaxID=487732 RepID=UPI00036EE11D|nr:transcriptional repressor [Corynebacterium ulceribovis]